MPKYVALLRAINVGGHIVRMEHLRAWFVEMGFSGVETFIASGNVIFDSKVKTPTDLERRIETALLKALGYEVVTMIRTVPELGKVATCPAFDESATAGNRVYVGFMKKLPAKAAAQKVVNLADANNEFRLNQREIYWLRRPAAVDFVTSRIEKTLGVATTFRGLPTVKKIADKYS